MWPFYRLSQGKPVSPSRHEAGPGEHDCGRREPMASRPERRWEVDTEVDAGENHEERGRHQHRGEGG